MTTRTRRKTKWKLVPGDTDLVQTMEPEILVVLDEGGDDGYLWIGGPHGPCVGTLSGQQLRELRDTLNTLELADDPHETQDESQ